MNLHFVTANVQGLGEQSKRAHLRLHLLDAAGLASPDVLFMQELCVGDKNPESWTLDLEGVYQFFISPGAVSDPHAGTGIAVKRGSFEEASLIEHDRGGRWTAVHVRSQLHGTLVLISVYAPVNRELQRDFFCNLPWDLVSGDPVIMAGDWNVSRTAQDTYPRLRTEEPHARARDELNARMIADGFVDIWRERHPEERSYTWYNRRARGLDAARVDYILVSADIVPRVRAADILDRLPWSDHAPVRVEVE